VAANDELEKMFGHARGTLVGLPIETLLPKTLHESHVGLRTAFVTRPLEFGPDGKPDLQPNASVDVAARDFNDLASRLGA